MGADIVLRHDAPVHMRQRTFHLQLATAAAMPVRENLIFSLPADFSLMDSLAFAAAVQVPLGLAPQATGSVVVVVVVVLVVVVGGRQAGSFG